jgi:hypothetical protein
VWKDFDNRAEGNMKANQIEEFIRRMIAKNSNLLPVDIIRDAKLAEQVGSSAAFNRRMYIASLNCQIYNNWQAKEKRDVPCVVFIDFLQAMLRQRFIRQFEEDKQKLKTPDILPNLSKENSLDQSDR